MTTEMPNDLTALTVDLLSAFVANNNVRTDDLPALIASTHAALAGLSASDAAPEAETAVAGPAPAVSARKSLGSREHIISMIDGKPYKTLKRHLSGHGMSPEQYRERYGLPATYPMVAPAYSEARRETAKRLGLGRKPAAAAPAPEPVEAPQAAAKPARKPGRPKAAKPAANAGE
jgi:predicted transcriptional regulator